MSRPEPESDPGAESSEPRIASFVVRLMAPSAGRLVAVSPTARVGWTGRVEHIQSRRSATFDNPEELIRFMESCLGVDG